MDFEQTYMLLLRNDPVHNKVSIVKMKNDCVLGNLLLGFVSCNPFLYDKKTVLTNLLLLTSPCMDKNWIICCPVLLFYFFNDLHTYYIKRRLFLACFVKILGPQPRGFQGYDLMKKDWSLFSAVSKIA